jgi:hypothetical protein
MTKNQDAPNKSGLMRDERFVLYCKTYEGDAQRLARLADSIRRFNADRIRFYVSAPSKDRALFRKILGGDFDLLDDEEIIAANSRAVTSRYASMDGRITQQIVKSEFWRLVPCRAYLCIDSDGKFLRPFRCSDFIDNDGIPFTVIHENKELLQMAFRKGKHKVVRDFERESERMKVRFGRTGPNYLFGPAPFLWSAAVWRDLDEKYLQPRDMTFWDAIDEDACEWRWYAEAQLAFNSIPMRPREPYFRVYHYDWQWQEMRRRGETEETIARDYLGVVYQSNWEFEMDAGSKVRPVGSRLVRRLKRWINGFI